MKKEPIINIGNAAFDIETLEDIDIHITFIHIDIHLQTVTVSYQIGLKVSRVELSLHEAQKIGFINKKALIPYLK